MTQKNNPLIITAIGLLIASNTVVGQNAEAEATSVVNTESVAVSAGGETVAPAMAQATPESTELSVLKTEQTETPSFAATVQGNTPLADTLSVDFPDEDIRNVLRNVADLFELNIIIPDALVGRTSIKLRDVTWRELFKVVLEPIGYTFVEERSIIKIVSRDALQLEPFETRSVILDNVPATSVEPILRPMLSPAVAATPAMAARVGGTLVVNSLANEIIITDQPEVIRRMVETVDRMDTEPRQVVIQTKFVEITKTDEKALGVKLAGNDVTIGGGSSLSNFFGNSIAGEIDQDPISGPLSNNIILTNSDFTAVLSALSTISGSKIVSNPTIVAVNGSRSQIEIGTDVQTIIETRTTDTTGSSTTAAPGEKIFEGVKVDITPQISSNKLVSLRINAEKSEIARIKKGSGDSPTEFYDVRRRTGSLNMILSDGQTAAIGGLIDRSERKRTQKTPFLGDLPVLGALFRDKNSTVVDSNLIIFITANILEPSKTTYRNVATRQQLKELEVTQRDIEGVNYKPSAEEESLYNALQELRAKRQAAEIQQQLDATLNAPPPESSKR